MVHGICNYNNLHVIVTGGDLSSILTGKLTLSLSNAKKIESRISWDLGTILTTEFAEVVAYVKFKLVE